MIAPVATAQIVSAPVPTEDTDVTGTPVKTLSCSVEVAPEGREVDALILPLFPGLSPDTFRVGDRVLVLLGLGVAYVVGAFVPFERQAGQVMMQPRGSGNVFVGPYAAGAENSDFFLMYKRASDEIQNLKAQIDALVALLDTPGGVFTAPPGGGPVTPTTPSQAGNAVSGVLIAGGITGGKPSKQVLGRPTNA